MFYGEGRVNMVKAVDAVDSPSVPPEAEISSPEWYAHVDPGQPTVAVHGQVYARGHAYSCKVYVAPGSEPNNGFSTDLPAGDCPFTRGVSSLSGPPTDIERRRIRTPRPASARPWGS